jgi:hypothetical protein
MSMWLVDIETVEGVVSSAEALERFAAKLDASLGTTGAATSVDSTTGMLSATFSVAAVDAQKATEVGIGAFREALTASGLAEAEPARVAVERVGADEGVRA